MSPPDPRQHREFSRIQGQKYCSLEWRGVPPGVPIISDLYTGSKHTVVTLFGQIQFDKSVRPSLVQYLRLLADHLESHN